MFCGSKSVIIHGGAITHESRVMTLLPLQSDAFKILQSKVAPGAFHNSGERFDPPKCHPRTRRAVIKRIMEWVIGKESMDSLIMWLNGAAGAGKSAIAQTIAELCDEAGVLLASFFFSWSDPYRNNGATLFPTLAYQIACAIPEAREHLERAIDRDPLIFTRSLEAQMLALIVEPLRPLIASGCFSDKAASKRLIILDGLDEIVEHRTQAQILEVISNTLVRHHIPVIVLVASRPEQQIVFSFNSRPISPLTHRLCLDDKFHADNDIRLFLVETLSDIKDTHPRKNHIPQSWPSPEVMNILVRKASGQFIYASTTAKFVASLRHKPTDRLEIILGLRPVHRDLPFAELDALYIHILSALEDPQRTLLVIGVLLSRGPHTNDYHRTSSGIEHLLGLDVGDVELLLADMASLVALEGDEIKTIRMLHASFGDFLFDSSRSGAFAINSGSMHTRMSCLCLQHINLRMYDPLEDDWSDQYGYMINNLGYHLIRSKPTTDLIDHLSQLSWGVLLDDIRAHIQHFPDRRSSASLRYAWATLPTFVSAIESYDLNKSLHVDLRNRLYDAVIKSELDILQDNTFKTQPSANFLLCLCSVIHRFKFKHPWMHSNVVQVTGWNGGSLIPDFSSQSCQVNEILLHDSGVLHKFLHDSSRSGKYYLAGANYADASVSCLNYLVSHRLALPLNMHRTRRNDAARRTSPYRTRQLIKYLDRRRVWREYKLLWRTANSRYPNLSLPKLFPKLYSRFYRQKIYSRAIKLGLKFLPKALPLSAESDALIALARAEKPFSGRALQFPVHVKKCRAAISAYLMRVEGADSADMSTQIKRFFRS